MAGRKLVLADGTEYSEGECGYAEGVLWCYLPQGTGMNEAFTVFSDKNKTNRIIFHYGEMQDEHIGFTDLTGVIKNADGQLSVRLMRPAV